MTMRAEGVYGLKARKRAGAGALNDFLRKFDLSRSAAARLFRTAERNVEHWCNGENRVPEVVDEIMRALGFLLDNEGASAPWIVSLVRESETTFTLMRKVFERLMDLQDEIRGKHEEISKLKKQLADMHQPSGSADPLPLWAHGFEQRLLAVEGVLGR
jgi:hypothetical protein